MNLVQKIQLNVLNVENNNLSMNEKSNKNDKDDLLKQVNDNNKTIEGYITTLLPAVLALINNQIYNVVIYFYIFLVSDYFLNFMFNLFLRKVEDTDKIRNLFDFIIRTLNFSKYIFILYLLIISLK